MTSSRLENPTHTTGTHRAQRHLSRPAGQRPPARYEAYLDGLFTYCLSVLCDHEAATAVLGNVLSVSERQFSRCPSDEPGRRAWLYALARWACLRKLAEQKRLRPGAHTGRAPAKPSPAEPSPAQPGSPAQAGSPAQPPSGAATERQRRDLAALAWPEAAGTTPEQREALELAVRHQLSPREVAAVLGLELAAARTLLAAAACEVERTRAALAVVETGNCPGAARLTGDRRMLLSSALRRELVRHVDDCPRCRKVAERAGAAAPWPGSSVTPATPAALPLVAAERSATYTAMLHAQRGSAPRFGRDGFPLDPKDRAARRDRLRARAVTTTVVATVVAAPVLALWAAYRHAPATGEGHGGSVTTNEAEGPGGARTGAYDHYENAGNARTDHTPFTGGGSSSPDVSVEVISPSTGAKKSPAGEPLAAGSLTVEARSSGGRTTITLTSGGDRPVAWSAWRTAPWVHLSSTSGTLQPGRSVTLHVYVDHRNEPNGAWSARIGINPAGAVVSLQGYGHHDRSGGHGGHGHHRRPTPTDQPPTTGPAAPPGDPTPGDPSPGDPTPPPSDPTPTPTPPSDPPTSPPSSETNSSPTG
ncbi:hypothetical protein AB0M87_29845 [Streptomyces sp. NPDC051320]|uniref:BACON domain-containing protein n=1 Tax=Streptomyces sp. NPDC051320 TaxID=3154644 RepID=UPI0034184A71